MSTGYQRSPRNVKYVTSNIHGYECDNYNDTLYSSLQRYANINTRLHLGHIIHVRFLQAGSLFFGSPIPEEYLLEMNQLISKEYRVNLHELAHLLSITQIWRSITVKINLQLLVPLGLPSLSGVEKCSTYDPWYIEESKKYLPLLEHYT